MSAGFVEYFRVSATAPRTSSAVAQASDSPSFGFRGFTARTSTFDRS